MGIPIDAWVRIRLEEPLDPGKSGAFLAFTYVDSEAGLSAKGDELAGVEPTPDEVVEAAERPGVTVRLPGFDVAPLDDGEIARLGLPVRPPWLDIFEPPSRPRPVWRDDPALHGKFSEQFPDDLCALFLFPGHPAELMWVRLDGIDPAVGGYAGRLLNTPHAAAQGSSLPVAGDRVTIRVVQGVEHPIHVDDIIRENLREWSSRCHSCGCDVVPIPIRELIRRQFPQLPAGGELKSMTTRCPFCRQTMVISKRGLPLDDPDTGPPDA
jgi:hypothetical protein